MAKKKRQSFVRSEWIFDWKRSTSTPFSSWFAILLVAGMFTLMLVSLRIKLVEPVDWEAPQASVIHLSGEGWSHALVLDARAKGPFPSRFEPDSWLGANEMKSVIAEASKPLLAAHQPRLMPYPDPGIQPPGMARRGEPVLPDRASVIAEPQVARVMELTPVITALDGIRSTELPAKLPDWDQPTTEVLTARPWKFLVEIDASGRVRQCVSLAGGQELSPKELTRWLRGVVFAVKQSDQGSRWAAVSIEFQNRPTSE